MTLNSLPNPIYKTRLRILHDLPFVRHPFAIYKGTGSFARLEQHQSYLALGCAIHRELSRTVAFEEKVAGLGYVAQGDTYIT